MPSIATHIERRLPGKIANLTLHSKDPFHVDATSPNAMVLDTPDDLTIDLTNSDKDDVVLISHDEVEAEVPAPPVASDCRSKPTHNNHASQPTIR
jgi:ubiquitin carboxyl-terminal hydrolase 7